MIQLYNSLTKQIEVFKPLKENEVGLYCCGPTVYNYAHIGNMRTYLYEDLLRRVLMTNGYHVRHVMNITDVGHLSSDGDEGEDKMLKSAREKGMDVWAIARFFTDAFFADSERLHIVKPTIVCEATAHIDQMIAMIQKIEEAGYAYASGGNIYFDTSKDDHYGLLRGYGLRKDSHSRVDNDHNKRNPEDFVLWFTESKFERQAMVWPSPWGVGYPGWHIECSAMSEHYLGTTFDIHCGGIDHVSIHHTNELAQSYAAFHTLSANYWMHGEFLTIDNSKMSKSAEGFLTVSKLIDMGYDPLDYRYFCFTAHYRKQLAFHEQSLTAAKNARRKLLTKSLELKPFLNEKGSDQSEEMFHLFMEKLNNDLNMPEALAVLWNVVKSDSLNQAEKAWILNKMESILAIGLFKEQQEEILLTDNYLLLIEERSQAKREKDFARADAIRDELLSKGILLKDTPEGVVWEKIN